MARALAVLRPADPRRAAADLIAGSYERIGAVGGGGGGDGDGDDGSGCTGEVSDGGVTTRIKHAERIRLIEALANDWAVDRTHGRVVRGPERVALPVRRKRPGRHEIKAFPLLIALCVEGQDMAQILKAHGWKVRSDCTGVLISVAWEILDDIADALGLGRAVPEIRGLTATGGLALLLFNGAELLHGPRALRPGPFHSLNRW